MRLWGTKGLFVLKRIVPLNAFSRYRYRLWENEDAGYATHHRVIVNIAVIVSAIVCLLLFSCSDDVSRDNTTLSMKSGHMNSDTTLRIVIQWPGDDFATQKDLETRGEIESLILKRKVGKIIRVGTGMGWMDISVEVRDETVAKPEIKEIIKKVAPTAKYVIE